MLQQKYPKLNLPHATLRLREVDSSYEVWDALRGRWLCLTPEEWVRQHFIHFMTTSMGVEPHRLAQEYRLRLNGRDMRADIVLFSRSGEPSLMVECKAPTVRIDQTVFDQIGAYNLALSIEYLVVTNGLTHYVCRIDHQNRSYSFLDELPLNL